MSRKIENGVRPGRHGLGRRILKVRTEFPDASWVDVGRRFGVSPNHARVLMRVSEEIPASIVESIAGLTIRFKARGELCLV